MGRKLTTEDFIEKAISIHGDKYNYKLVDYKGWSTKVKIICPEHGVFEQTPHNHIKGQGCPKCHPNHKKSTEEFIIDAYCKHGDKYNYKLVDYKGWSTKVKIICPEHGVFEQAPHNHIKGQGCPRCGRVKSTMSNRIGVDEWVYRSNKIHENKYEYSHVKYKNIKDKVKIICPEHGIFEQEADSHQRGVGCPKCFGSISKQETELQEWLNEYIDIKTNNRTLIKPLELDIVIPEKRIAIEYNGLYWHSERQGKDIKYHLNKYNFCKEQGYRLIQIWENEWLSKQDIVKSILLNAIGINKRVIHGRKCVIKDVTPKDARVMYDNNHIQGFKGGQHKGLYYDDELISLMTIDARNELQRFVNKKYTKVHGSFSKLLKSFINEGYKDIYTFADLRFFTGNVYEKNGFKYDKILPPRYCYFKKIIVYHRRHFQKKNIERKYNKEELQYYDKNKTEYQNMLANGYDRIWDSGKMRYKYNAY